MLHSLINQCGTKSNTSKSRIESSLKRLMHWAILFFCLGTATLAQGDVIFNGTWNGGELFHDPTISFPTRPPVLDGPMLVFNAGVFHGEKLFEIPLVPANTLSTEAPVVVSITFTLTRRSGDFDPSICINDGGENNVGFQVFDNDNGGAAAVNFIDANHDNIGEYSPFRPSLFVGVGYPNIGQQLTAQATFTLNASATNIYGSFRSRSGNTNVVALNRMGALSLAFWGENAGELYGINSLSVRVEGTLNRQDRMPPDTVITVGPTPNSTVCGPDVSFTVSGIDDLTPANQLQYQWQMDGSAWSGWTTETHITVTNLLDGSHTFSVRARDASGNVDPTPAELSFQVDATPPVLTNVTIVLSPGEAIIEWDTDENATGVVEFGNSTQYGSSAVDPRLRLHHRLRLNNPTLPLHLRVRSADACGNETVSQNYPVTLTISNVQAVEIGRFQATITYTTSLTASSHIDYGRSVFYNKTATDAAPNTQHSLTLTNLADSTTYHVRAKASLGNLTVYSEDVAFRTQDGSNRVMHVTGRIELQEIDPEHEDNRSQWVRFEFRTLDGSEVLILGAKLEANGDYTLNDVPRRNFTMAVKGAKWLQKTLTITAPFGGDVTGKNASLLAGDANDDNSVDVFDLDILIQNFNTTDADAFFDTSADFNCDGSVDVYDLDLLIRNFNKEGEP